jgi:hypothetical protein
MLFGVGRRLQFTLRLRELRVSVPYTLHTPATRFNSMQDLLFLAQNLFYYT